jgi:hypothetical protein
VDEPTAPRTCSGCHKHPAGPGGVLCESCLARMTAANATYWKDHEIVLVRGVARVVAKQGSVPADGAQPAPEHTPAG